MKRGLDLLGLPASQSEIKDGCAVEVVDEAVVLTAIKGRGFVGKVTINTVVTKWWPSWDGSAGKVSAPSGANPVSPYEPLVLDVYSYQP